MTTAEIELDQNTNFDWNRIQESGKDMEPLYGPGYTGLINLGNRYICPSKNYIGASLLFSHFFAFVSLILVICSCYLAATMQVVFSTRSFYSRLAYTVPYWLCFENTISA